MFNPKRICAALLAALTIAALTACGSDNGGGTTSNAESTATQATTNGETTNRETSSGDGGQTQKPPTISVRNGEPVDGVAQLEYKAGDQIEFAVMADVTDEVHVHGYDLSKEVPAGGTVSFNFPAEIEGIFEVELEESGVQVAELRVNP